MVGENGLVGGELIARVVINLFFLMTVLCLCLCLTKGIVESRFGWLRIVATAEPASGVISWGWRHLDGGVRVQLLFIFVMAAA
jgi:hypothetical protein